LKYVYHVYFYNSNRFLVLICSTTTLLSFEMNKQLNPGRANIRNNSAYNTARSYYEYIHTEIIRFLPEGVVRLNLSILHKVLWPFMKCVPHHKCSHSCHIDNVNSTKVRLISRWTPRQIKWERSDRRQWDVTNWTCSTREGDAKCIIFVAKLKWNGPLIDWDINSRMILKWILNNVYLWALGLTCLGLGFSGGLLCAWKWHFGFHRRRISLPAELL
jgi:hypothetical protein